METIFKQSLNLASVLETNIELLYINTPYNFKESEERGIQFFMKNSDADLFAIARRGKSTLSRSFSQCLSESTVIHLEIPVLVFHI